MKHPDDVPRCNIELAAETLAVAFSECNGMTSPQEDGREKGVTRIGGKSLFRKFVKENTRGFCNPEFVENISEVGFGGFLQDPPTLLLQGDASRLQYVRNSWSNSLLRAPAGYHIDFVGDVTRIGARPLPRGQFVPLCDAVCVSVGNVTSRSDVATQEAILIELNRTFRGVHSPSRELLHETLGKLIRSRKVFCTGPEYHLVTTKTYSGKASDEDSTSSERHSSQDCQACAKNRTAFADQNNKHRSCRTKKIREGTRTVSTSPHTGTNLPLIKTTSLEGSKSPSLGTNLPFPEVVTSNVGSKLSPAEADSSPARIISPFPGTKSPVTKARSPHAESKSRLSQRKPSPSCKNSALSDVEGLHGSVLNGTVKRESNPVKLEKRQRKKSADREKRSSIVGRVADKLFRKRRKSWSGQRVSGHSDLISPERCNETFSPSMRQLSEDEARRLGYETSHLQKSASTGLCSPDKGHGSQSRAVQSHLSDEGFVDVRQPKMPEPNETDISRSSGHDRSGVSTKRRDDPSFVPANATGKTGIRKSESERKIKTYRPEVRRSVSGSNRFPELRDVAVSCNLEESIAPISSSSFQNTTSPAQCTTASYMAMTSPAPQTNRIYPRRSKSLKLPRERLPTSSVFLSEQIKPPPPDYSSLRKSDASSGLTFYFPQRVENRRQMQRSVSSNSAKMEHSYLRAIDAAPSVRIGSVIAEHLEELERRRQYWSRRSGHDLSPSPSVTSSAQSCRSRDASTVDDVTHHVHEKDVHTPEKMSDDESDLQANKQMPETLDPETEAAVKVAKRLARLDLRMTRQEWTEYFSHKVLPSEVEKALKEAEETETDYSQYESPTCFEDTSGSVETVIDVHERNSKSIKNRSRITRANSSTTSEHLANSRKSSEEISSTRDVSSSELENRAKLDENEYATLRMSDLSPIYNGGNSNLFYSPPEDLVREQHPSVLYRCPDANSDEDFDTPVLYNCVKGHTHSPYGEQHRKFVATDNASLTEDSGFYSARERTSMSSWDTRRKPRGTFV